MKTRVRVLIATIAIAFGLGVTTGPAWAGQWVYEGWYPTYQSCVDEGWEYLFQFEDIEEFYCGNSPSGGYDLSLYWP